MNRSWWWNLICITFAISMVFSYFAKEHIKELNQAACNQLCKEFGRGYFGAYGDYVEKTEICQCKLEKENGIDIKNIDMNLVKGHIKNIINYGETL